MATQAGKSKRLRTIISATLKFVLASGLIYWLIQKGLLDFAMLAKLAHPQYLVPLLIITFVPYFLNNYRWLVLLQGQGFESTVKKTLPLTYIGVFFNFAMPGGVGGDVVKGYYLLQEHKDRKMAAATSILMDRIIGFFVMLLLSLAALVMNWKLIAEQPHIGTMALTIFGATAAFVLLFVVSFSRRIHGNRALNWVFEKMPGGHVVKGFYSTLHSYRHSLRAFWTACALSVVSQGLTILAFNFIGSAIGGADIPWYTYFLVVPVGLIATALPVAPAGIGVGQAVFLVLFEWTTGTKTSIGPNLMTAYQMVGFLWGFVGAFFYFTRKKPKSFETSLA